ncbi:MAG: 1-deoxy-D-xylulose-5-phosphate synthase [Eubacteriales bacterium]|nr:1-deoxy-D-xylulose-5-phosphate synthase [Eubacteriales bacterium]
MQEDFPDLHKPQDLKGYTIAELEQLAAACRKEIIQAVAQHGGHLASNLGTVELTLALAKVFNFGPQGDRLIFDVGHQCYTWKLITGRQAGFAHLRQQGGLSGFPKSSESPYDFYNAGHSSDAISIALGYQRADRLQGRKRQNIVLIGDGGLTGGVSYEALNDAGQKQDALKIILNDNQMSIDQNVGGLARHLEKLRVSPSYRDLKHKVSGRLSPQSLLRLGLGKLKKIFRLRLNQNSAFFESLGFRYYGPVDGHDFEALLTSLKALQDSSHPTVLHVITQKGRGYSFAEEDPASYHGVGKFDLQAGLPTSEVPQYTFSACLSRKLLDLGAKDQRVCAITAAMAQGTGLDAFAAAYPDRFYDVGIAEQHAASLAAGLALGGLRPFAAIYSTFSQRAVDQILHDICLQNVGVTLLLDRAGLVGNDGETHQGLYDTAIFQALPNLQLFAPADSVDLDLILDYALSQEGPVMVRYPKAQAKPDLALADDQRSILAARQLAQGSDYTLLVFGSLAGVGLAASQDLAQAGGPRGDLFSLVCGKGADLSLVKSSLAQTRRLLIVEEAHSSYGFASQALLQLSGQVGDFRYKIIAVDDPLRGQAGRTDLLQAEGLDASGLAQQIGNFIQEVQEVDP